MASDFVVWIVISLFLSKFQVWEPTTTNFSSKLCRLLYHLPIVFEKWDTENLWFQPVWQRFWSDVTWFFPRQECKNLADWPFKIPNWENLETLISKNLNWANSKSYYCKIVSLAVGFFPELNIFIFLKRVFDEWSNGAVMSCKGLFCLSFEKQFMPLFTVYSLDNLKNFLHKGKSQNLRKFLTKRVFLENFRRK